jgi:hypothetical protein
MGQASFLLRGTFHELIGDDAPKVKDTPTRYGYGPAKYKKFEELIVSGTSSAEKDRLDP